jgi:hypothetical protein
MAISIEKVIHNLHFDRLFLDRIAHAEHQTGKQLHGNGVPFHYVSVFKILMVLPENKMEQHHISFYYREVFGRSITQSSLSRTLSYLKKDLGLVMEKDNPIDARNKWVGLTALGKKFRQHLVGSTSVAKDVDPKGQIRNVVKFMPSKMSNS